MSDAIFIADELLKIAKRHNKSMSPMKLMKLTYIAHGWALALLDRDLFQNRIEAWRYGPVIPDLYHATKRFGGNEISLDMIDDEQPSHLDDETRAFLEDVWNKYGHLDAIALSNLTHQPGTPWEKVYNPRERNTEIPDSLIRTHYKALAHGRNAATG